MSVWELPPTLTNLCRCAEELTPHRSLLQAAMSGIAPQSRHLVTEDDARDAVALTFVTLLALVKSLEQLFDASELRPLQPHDRGVPLAELLAWIKRDDARRAKVEEAYADLKYDPHGEALSIKKQEVYARRMRGAPRCMDDPFEFRERTERPWFDRSTCREAMASLVSKQARNVVSVPVVTIGGKRVRVQTAPLDEQFGLSEGRSDFMPEYRDYLGSFVDRLLSAVPTSRKEKIRMKSAASSFFFSRLWNPRNISQNGYARCISAGLSWDENGGSWDGLYDTVRTKMRRSTDLTGMPAIQTTEVSQCTFWLIVWIYALHDHRTVDARAVRLVAANLPHHRPEEVLAEEGKPNLYEYFHTERPDNAALTHVRGMCAAFQFQLELYDTSETFRDLREAMPMKIHEKMHDTLLQGWASLDEGPSTQELRGTIERE